MTHPAAVSISSMPTRALASGVRYAPPLTDPVTSGSCRLSWREIVANCARAYLDAQQSLFFNEPEGLGDRLNESALHPTTPVRTHMIKQSLVELLAAAAWWRLRHCSARYDSQRSR
jgi:hypothetical protein